MEEYVTLQLHDAQLERIEALMERNMARQEAIASDIKGELKLLNAKIDGVEQRLEAKIDAVEKRLEAKIDAVEKRLETKIDGVMDAVAITNSRVDDLHNKKSNNIALWAIFATVAGILITTVVGVYQLFVR